MNPHVFWFQAKLSFTLAQIISVNVFHWASRGSNQKPKSESSFLPFSHRHMPNPLLRPGPSTSKIHPFSTSAFPTSGHASSTSAGLLHVSRPPCHPFSTTQQEWLSQHTNLITLVLENLHNLGVESNLCAMAWETLCDGHLPRIHSPFLSCPIFISHYTLATVVSLQFIPYSKLFLHTTPSAWNAAHHSTIPSLGFLHSLNITSSESLPRPLYLYSLLNLKFSQAVFPLSPLYCKLQESSNLF